MGRPLTVKVMEILGFRHVPDKMVQVIERNGRYHRTTTRTFAKHWPFFESFGPQIKTGLHMIDQMCKNVGSRDGLLYNISVSTKVFFDVRQVDPGFMPIVVQFPEIIIRGRVQAIVDMALREEVALLDSTTLLQPGVVNQINNAIKHRLARDLEKFGASLPSAFFEDTLYIKEILPPDRLHDTRVEATNISETIENLADKHQEEVRQAIFAHMYRDMGAKPLQIRAMNMPDVSRPDNEPADESDPKFPVLRQPTGRVYDN